jgi:hypothetical protein
VNPESLRDLKVLWTEEAVELEELVDSCGSRHFEALSEFLAAVREARSVLEDALALG